ncbi:MAG TPA: hypothetical protein DCM40_28375, partial [Maribacter sp.]|nr:hypothetical protein [Maribacter sp.]
IKVTEFAQGGGGTRLSGNSIQTGIIQSSNFNASTGSRINLNDGTVNFGGSSGSSFAVDAEGAVTASNALIEGEVIAANLTEKYLVVNDTNSGSYLRYVSGDATTGKKNLVFDGSLNGGICMHMEISCSTGFTINDIELPFTGSALAAGNVYIQTPDMTFDDQVVQPTFQLLLKSFQTGILLGGSSRNEQLVPFE